VIKNKLQGTIMASHIDAITSEVILNSLLSITEEMNVALVRSAYSTNIKERKDCSCAIFDNKGNLVVLAENIPIHLGSMQGLMNEICSNIDNWDFKPGDIVIANDPYLGGGSHLPDITLIKPVFFQNELVNFAANIAHWTDVGGRTPGVGTAGDSTEIYQEGLRIPPTKIIRKDVIHKVPYEIIFTNMRGRKEREGDLRAQIASLNLGETRIKELYKDYGQPTMASVKKEIFKYSERWLRKALHDVPKGSYSFSDWMDDDGVSDKPLLIKVRVTVNHGYMPNIIFDFTGTSSQASGGINLVRQALLATVNYAVKAIVAPNVPINEGFQRPIKIRAPKKSLVNAKAPAAVGGRTDTCQRVVDTIMGALAQIIPDKVVAASNGATTAIIFAGTEELSGSDFVYVEALGGGMGARSTKDGMDGVQVHITNTSNLPVEALEMEYPLRVLRYGLFPDTGGPGRFRGGLAIRKDIQVLVPLLFSAHSDRHRFSPWGIQGGAPGKRGRFLLYPSQKRPRRIRSKISGFLLRKGDVLSAQTAGGGGFGQPHKRKPERVLKDYLEGKLSRGQAQKEYGVVLTHAKKINYKATRVLRDKMKTKNGNT
jgi:N-methylhydantoinase B